eukprot:1940211-Amphidinium_carterae.1
MPCAKWQQRTRGKHTQWQAIARGAGMHNRVPKALQVEEATKVEFTMHQHSPQWQSSQKL